MRKFFFVAWTILLAAPVLAGSDDKWVLANNPNPALNIVPLLLAIGAFVWIYVIYKDLKIKSKRKR